MAPRFLFHRPEIASRIADRILAVDALSDGSGLFLAAPRRTGKSTFLRSDLLPELERRSVAAVYVDLWSDRSRDPSDLVVSAVRQAIDDARGGVSKAARRAGSRIGLPGVATVDLSRPEKALDTLPALLKELADVSGRTIALVVDEAQHATTSESGRNAMFALKSARDQLNLGHGGSQDAGVRLGLVFTGSNVDRLASLVLGKGAPFFGSRVTEFPLLGRDYTDALATAFNSQPRTDAAIDPDELWNAFRTLAFRPQMLMSVVTEAAAAETLATGGLTAFAHAAREEFWREFDDQHEAMTPLQRSVLAELVESGPDFRPYAGETLARLSGELGMEIPASEIQSALDGLREQGVVVKLARGAYTLDDTTLVEWHGARWPVVPETSPDEQGTRP